MQGYVINRSGTFKHVFKQNIAPNEKIPLDKLYSSYHKKFPEPTVFLSFIRKVEKDVNGIVLENFNEKGFLDSFKKESPVVETLVVSTVDVTGEDVDISPKQLAHMEFNDESKKLLKSITNTRTLTYALTLARKNGINKKMQRALARRIDEIKGDKKVVRVSNTNIPG